MVIFNFGFIDMDDPEQVKPFLKRHTWLELEKKMKTHPKNAKLIRDELLSRTTSAKRKKEIHDIYGVTIKTPSRLIWNNKDRRYIMNPDHPDYMKCDTCGHKETFGDDHYCTLCFTCDLCPHRKDHRNHRGFKV